MTINEDWKVGENEYKCPECDNIYTKAGIGAHHWRKHGTGKNFNPNIDKNGNTRTAWNKGLTKETDARVNAHAKSLVESHEAGKVDYTSFRTSNYRNKMSSFAKEHNFGGYRPHPNRGERYNGIWFDSSWEVRVAKSLDSNEIVWERPDTGFTWNKNGNKYYPDFYLPAYDVYLEPKNDYLITKDETKINNAQKIHSIRVLILRESQLDWATIKLLITPV